MCWHRSGSTMTKVMACCLMAPSHYLNQCWYIISRVMCHSPKGNNSRNAHEINHHNSLEIYTSNIKVTSPRGQWVNISYKGLLQPWVCWTKDLWSEKSLSFMNIEITTCSFKITVLACILAPNGAWPLAGTMLTCCKNKVNTLRPRQNGRHFPDNIFKCIFLFENTVKSLI